MVRMVFCREVRRAVVQARESWRRSLTSNKTAFIMLPFTRDKRSLRSLRSRIAQQILVE
jgi:hypothetical protein